MKLIPVLMVSISLCTATQAYEGTTLAADARKALAVVSGTLRVPGLRKPVRVLRDKWGVAHIYAQNQHDLFFAQGVVAAQDRLFQMEVRGLAASDGDNGRIAASIVERMASTEQRRMR